MPELPEVETVAADLRATLTGRTLVTVALGRAGVLRFPAPELFTPLLAGRAVESVERRGKFILCGVGGGEDLVFHLGMTGHLTVCAGGSVVAPHTHLRAGLDDGRELRFDDARRFGRILLGRRTLLEEAGALPRLGVEPLSEGFTAARLDALLRSTTRPVKAVLLDQSAIAGMGNIYADEACHLAGIRPSRRAHRLSRAERAALHAAIPAVLGAAIRNRGTTFDDFRDVWNARGRNGEELRVYGRALRPCLGCGTPLRRSVVAGRTTVHCPRCQR